MIELRDDEYRELAKRADDAETELRNLRSTGRHLACVFSLWLILCLVDDHGAKPYTDTLSYCTLTATFVILCAILLDFIREIRKNRRAKKK